MRHLLHWRHGGEQGAFFGGLADSEPDAWGYGDFDMPTIFWSNLLDDGDSMGVALNHAKEQFYSIDWQDSASRPFARVCVLETVLYGEPAAQIGM